MKSRVDVYGSITSSGATSPLALLSSVSDMCCTPVLLSLRLVASFIQVTNWIFFDCLLNSSKTSLHIPYLTSLDDCDCAWIRQFFFSASCSRYLLPKSYAPWYWLGLDRIWGCHVFSSLLLRIYLSPLERLSPFFFYYYL